MKFINFNFFIYINFVFKSNAVALHNRIRFYPIKHIFLVFFDKNSIAHYFHKNTVSPVYKNAVFCLDYFRTALYGVG